MSLKEKTQSLFANAFGYPATHTIQAPGRVNLIGEHTDYNDGFVLPCAIDYQTVISCAPRDDRKVRVMAADYENQLDEFSLDAPIVAHESYQWANYVRGVVKHLQLRNNSFGGVDMVISGNVPQGAGLSSSASLEVAVGTVLQQLYHLPLDGAQIALNGQEAENQFVGCNCGIMDQFAVAMGKKDHAIFLDTSTLNYEYAPVVLEDAKIVITNSKVKHSLVDSAYNQRRQECTDALSELQSVVDIKTLGDLDEETFEKHKDAIKDPIRQKRARHAVKENQRTIQAVAALRAGDITRFGQLMNQSHISLRDDYEVSCEEIDILVDLAWALPGVIGSRITGGGFGGCTVSIVKNDAVDTFTESIGQAYKEKVGHEAEFYIVDIGDGAKRL